ncbi:hypothetical protein [uncultured Modestobacter sp.]|uniref:hypothetical protein n=1 Tax=uncultured Modestobacter sp. TaxID=380048 RepID=UPI00260ECEAD|nr:hypothetical protein [uncultured Modestobacter sp.]
MSDHSRCCAGHHDGKPRKRSGQDVDPAIPLAGPISTTIVSYAARVRHRVGEDAVDRHARELHARASYDCWNGLSEKDQELWRHMARLDLTR